MAKAVKKTTKKKAVKKIRVGMIGCGGMANGVHYPSLASFDDVEFAGVCDINPDALKSTADKYGIEKRYSSYQKMVEEVTPDAVYVIGQPTIMYSIWLWALSEGLNLYIEKPMGITVHQAEMMAELAEKNHCITQVSFQRRSCPMVMKLRDEVLKRGPVVHALSRFWKKAGSNMGPTGFMMDDGVHAVDTLRWMCGGEVDWIESVCKRIQTPDINYFNALVQFDNGSTGNVMCNWNSGRRIFCVGMHGVGVAVEAEHEGKGYLYADGDYQGIEFDTKEVAGSDQNFVYGGFQMKNRQFIDAVRNKTLPPSHFGDAVKTMRLCDAILGKALLEGDYSV